MAGTRGFRISTKAPRDVEGLAVAGAGDVNGDEIPDIIVGIRVRPKTSGNAYVLFGKRDGSPVNTREPGVGGLTDFDGDGVPDILMAAEGAPGEGDRLGRDTVAGAAYILYGRR